MGQSLEVVAAVVVVSFCPGPLTINYTNGIMAVHVGDLLVDDSRAGDATFFNSGVCVSSKTELFFNDKIGYLFFNFIFQIYFQIYLVTLRCFEIIGN